MRAICLGVVLTAHLAGQDVGFDLLQGPTTVTLPRTESTSPFFQFAVYEDPKGVKVLFIQPSECKVSSPTDPCREVPQSEAENWGLVKRAVEDFKIKYGADDTPTRVVYELQPIGKPYVARAAPSPRPAAAGSGPVTPQLVVLEAKSNARLLLFDLRTLTTVNPVTLPNGARTFGIRPSQTGTGREVWTAHAGIGNQITITDLNAAKVVAAFPTQLDENSSPVNIVFSNNGKAAYYVVALPYPYVDGNLGKMLIYDADTRMLKSTVSLSIHPTSFLMAPDGLTAYILDGGRVAYYDVLSGTADLTVSLPGINQQWPVIHQDGNRLLSIQTSPDPVKPYAYGLSVFDLAQRKQVNFFPINFLAGKPVSMELSKDGSFVTLLSDKNEIQNVDVLTGSVISSSQSKAGTTDVFTAPLLP